MSAVGFDIIKGMKSLAFVSLFAVAGCLSASDPKTVFWPVDYEKTCEVAAAAKYQVARMSSVVVRAPYGDNRLAVLRPNGSIAFDDLNEYASSPAMLAKGIAGDAMRASGLFKSVIGSSSSVVADVAVEVVVTRLALDCREAGLRKALADVKVRLVENGRLVAAADGSGAVDAGDGRYGVAFTKAVSSAFDSAFSALR